MENPQRSGQFLFLFLTVALYQLMFFQMTNIPKRISKQVGAKQYLNTEWTETNFREDLQNITFLVDLDTFESVKQFVNMSSVDSGFLQIKNTYSMTTRQQKTSKSSKISKNIALFHHPMTIISRLQSNFDFDEMINQYEEESIISKICNGCTKLNKTSFEMARSAIKSDFILVGTNDCSAQFILLGSKMLQNAFYANQTELLALRKVFQMKNTNVKDPELLNKLKESRFKWELELQAFIKKDLNQNLADYNIRNKNLFKTYLSKITYLHPKFASQSCMGGLSYSSSNLVECEVTLP